MKPSLVKLILAIIIFTVSLAVSYYPLHKKGYATGGDFSALAEARNFAIAGTYQYESPNGVLLSTDKVATEGKKIGITNPLTPIIYGYIFKYFGTDTPLMPMYLAIVLAALFNVIIFLLTTQLFGPMIGFFSAITMAFMPVRIIGALSFSSYEFAMVFFGIALWLYLGSQEKLFKVSLGRLAIASAFFALAALARNAFLISFAPFVIFDFYKNRLFKRSLIFVLPFLIIFGSTLTSYSWLGVPNGYLADINNQPFNQIGHVFNDPYSLYYNKDNYLNNFVSQEKLNRVNIHFLSQWNYKVSWSERLKAYEDSVKFYLTRTFDLTNYGGPLIVFIMFLGGYWLYQNKKDMLWFFGFWFVIWFGGLVSFQTGNWDHFQEIIFMAAVLTGLGLYQLLELLKPLRFKQLIMSGILLVFIVGHLIYADKWQLFDSYRSSYFGAAIEMAKAEQDIKNTGVIAVGTHSTFADAFYYLTNRDVIYFNPSTIEELIKNGKLKEAFDIYKVKSALGYTSNLSNRMKLTLKIPVFPYDRTIR